MGVARTADDDEGLVLHERRGAVLVLTLNRPERLNAWNDRLEDRYFALLDAADDDPDVRAVVLTGAGRGFCAGADLDDVGDAAQAGGGAHVLARPHPRHHPLRFRKPLIAAINGSAAGLGLVEALFCDIRFCTPTAKLTTAFVRRGLIAEYGVSWLLPRLVGPARALDLLLSGRVVLGEEALGMGLVDRLHPAEELLDAAVAYAQDLAQHCSPTSMAVIKGQVHRHLDATFAEAVADSDRLLLESIAGVDVAEGVASFVERRPPAFAPLPPRTA
jgi:enoyl-CoA hydratase/carnithine racemase